MHEAAVNPHIDRSSMSGSLGSAKKKDYSEHKESLKIIQFLINQNANVNALNKYENTPLHAVCIEGLEDCAKALIDAGSSISQTTGDATNSSTPLHLAAEYSHPNLVRFLLDQGADPTVVNGENKTCLEVAMETNVFLSETHKEQTIDVLLAFTNGTGGSGEGSKVDEGTKVAGANNNGGSDGNDNDDNNDEPRNLDCIDLEEASNGSSTNVIAASSSEPRLSEDLTGEAAKIAAKRGRDAAAKKKKKSKKKEDEPSTGCKCIIS